MCYYHMQAVKRISDVLCQTEDAIKKMRTVENAELERIQI